MCKAPGPISRQMMYAQGERELAKALKKAADEGCQCNHGNRATSSKPKKTATQIAGYVVVAIGIALVLDHWAGFVHLLAFVGALVLAAAYAARRWWKHMTAKYAPPAQPPALPVYNQQAIEAPTTTVARVVAGAIAQKAAERREHADPYEQARVPRWKH